MAYDAIGNPLTYRDGIAMTWKNGNAITIATHIGNLNPFRYRGYYYDTESGFYYLMSRYYDPVTHRFINADGYFQAGGSILAANTFAYCGNNPVMNSDPTGEFWNIVAGAVIGGLVNGGMEVVKQIVSGKDLSEIDWVDVGIEVVTGAASGALDASGFGAVANIVLQGSMSAAGSVAKSIYHGDDFETTFSDAINSTLTTVAFASVKPVAKHIAPKGKHYADPGPIYRFANSKVDQPAIVKGVLDVIAPSKTVNAPTTKKTQTQCRACGRPIGNTYAWECSSPSYY